MDLLVLQVSSRKGKRSSSWEGVMKQGSGDCPADSAARLKISIF
jgi:hypothetical protein